MTSNDRAGLTLVELVITISLSAIIGVPVGILLSEHVGGALRARDYVVALNLARAEMEQLDSLGDNFCSISTTGPTPISGYPAYTLERVVSCQTSGSSCACSCTGGCGGAPSSARNDIKRIEVRVTKSDSTDRLATLVTYRTKYVLFGP